jgi:hypothetical protein
MPLLLQRQAMILRWHLSCDGRSVRLGRIRKHLCAAAFLGVCQRHSIHDLIFDSLEGEFMLQATLLSSLQGYPGEKLQLDACANVQRKNVALVDAGGTDRRDCSRVAPIQIRSYLRAIPYMWYLWNVPDLGHGSHSGAFPRAQICGTPHLQGSDKTVVAESLTSRSGCASCRRRQ